MAFLAEKNKSGITCPVCKKYVNRCMKLLPPYDCSVKEMCESCFNSLYKNPNLDRAAAKIDDTTNYSTQMRSADSFEKTDSVDDKEPDRGYEYAFPTITANDIKRECVGWLIIVLLLKTLFHIYLKMVWDTEVFSRDMMIFNGALALFSADLLVKKISALIRFKHCGVAKSRIKNLIFAIGIYGIILLWLAVLILINR